MLYYLAILVYTKTTIYLSVKATSGHIQQGIIGDEVFRLF